MASDSPLEIFTAAARDAGDWLRELQQENYRQREHGDDTAADAASQRRIIGSLAAYAREQQIPILAEEQTPEMQALQEEHRVELLVVGDDSHLPETYLSIDPLDGSVKWKFWQYDWAVSIALVQDGVPTAGVIYLPQYEKMFVAERGGGCTLNGERLPAPPQAELARALLALDMCESVDAQFDSDVNLPLTKACRYPVNLPSVAAVAGVIEGSLAACVSANTRNWDVVAAALCLQEVGGTFEPLAGGDMDWHLVKLPPLIGVTHQETLRTVRGALAI